jgi:CheY-like chemotaxis protein
MSAAVSFPSPPPLNPTTPFLEKRFSEVQLDESGRGRSTSLHCLIVDDNKINLQLLVMFMKKQKFSYVEAENGQEAVDRFKSACLPGPQSAGPSRRFDVVLMDISMPIMDGMEATRHIREFERENGLHPTNVIALTGLASAQAQEEALGAGIDVFLPKPVKFAQLHRFLMDGG